jgi:hypothetical protein
VLLVPRACDRLQIEDLFRRGWLATAARESAIGGLKSTLSF